jgi:2,4-dichlorophenol 6-monooxygenase
MTANRTDHDTDYDTDVLIVGTGPMGSATALALASYGIRCTAISRANWFADSPRAHVTNIRTMEVLRSLGIEDAVREQSTPWHLMGETKFATSLAGTEIARISSFGTGDDRYGDYLRASPSSMVDIPQSLLEPILGNAAAQRGATLEFNTLYLSSVQDDDGVTATLEHRPTGTVRQVRARYLIGADGARSQVAADAGIELKGQLARAGTVYAQFRGDLSAFVAHRPAILTWLINRDAAVGEIGLGLLRAVHPWDRWIAGWGFDVEQGEPDLSHETARQRIKTYVGDPDFEPEITAVGPWYVNEAYATQYSRGRIFCGGDAVHRHPPSNGLGSNTSIQDAFNLAWKLAYVIRGDATPALLESYSAERAPVGKQIVTRANESRRDFAPLKTVLADLDLLKSESSAGARARADLGAAVRLKNYEWNALGLEMNLRYDSGAVIGGDGRDEPWDNDPELFEQPTTHPGAMIPHVWLVDERGTRVSTLDLVGGGDFTLVTGLSGRAWAEAVQAIRHTRVRSLVVGDPHAQDLYQSWRAAREIAEDGALLVRPDGFIAWRAASMPTDPEGALRAALTALLGLTPATEAERVPA